MLGKSTKKGTILLVLYPEMSKVHASFRFAKRLKEQGYRIIYVGPSFPRNHILIHGFEYKVLEMDALLQNQMRHESEKITAEKKNLSRFQEWRLNIRMQTQMENQRQEHLLKKAEEWLKIDTPDLVLLDTLVWESSIPFLKLNIPVLVLNSCLTSAVNWRIPPVFSGIIPGEKIGWHSRVRNLLAWWKITRSYLYEEMYFYMRRRFALGFSANSSIQTPRKLVKKYGGKLRRCEYGYRLKLPELHLVPREFDFPCISEIRAGCYVGTCVDPERIERPFDWNKIDKTKPLVYCSAGSHPLKGLDKLYQSTVETIRQRPHLHLIVKVIDEAAAAKLKLLPENVTVVTWAPQVKILSRSFLFITHGGSSSVREAIYFGVPMIVFPHCRDQWGMAARVKYHHLGLVGNLKNVNDKIVGDLIDQVSQDHSIYSSVKKMQSIFQQQENCQEGLDFIENFLNSQPIESTNNLTNKAIKN